jgi:enolase
MPMMNIINGGAHASWVTDLQEYMIVPVGGKSVSQALQMGTEVFHSLAEVLNGKGYSTNVGDEGGYAPKVNKGNEEPFELISEAVSKSSYELGKEISFALDAAASEFFENGVYHLRSEKKKLSSEQMGSWLSDLVEKYPIISLEDPLDQEDWESWVKLTSSLGGKIQIVGDDLFVTNIKFLKQGIEKKAANAVLVKLNQIGTLSETVKVVEEAHQAGWKAIISHRSGETEDTTIAHLSVGLATGQIKSGSLCRSERVCKYNELLRIEEMLKENNYQGV